MKLRVNNCPICGIEIYRSFSQYKQLKGLATCSKECRLKYNKNVYEEKLKNRTLQEQKEYEERKFFSEKASHIKTRAKLKNIEYNLDKDFLKELYIKQNGLCYYSNIPLKLSDYPDPATLSVDRIDPTKGYTKDNVVLCANCINMLKGSMNLNEFKDILNFIIYNNNGSQTLKIKKIRENSIIPKKNSLGDVGYDLFASKIEETDDLIKVYSGISVEPEIGTYLELYPRSSIYKKNLILANSVGIIDNSYRGEIIAIFRKLQNFKKIEVGERFAQIIPKKYLCVDIKEVEEIESTDRGDNGFGSSGK